MTNATESIKQTERRDGEDKPKTSVTGSIEQTDTRDRMKDRRKVNDKCG